MSTLLKTCLTESTLKVIIDTTPIKEATTKGRTSNAPNNTTLRKIKIEILAILLFCISDVVHSIGSKSLFVRNALIDFLSP